MLTGLSGLSGLSGVAGGSVPFAFWFAASEPSGLALRDSNENPVAVTWNGTALETDRPSAVNVIAGDILSAATKLDLLRFTTLRLLAIGSTQIDEIRDLGKASLQEIYLGDIIGLEALNLAGATGLTRLELIANTDLTTLTGLSAGAATLEYVRILDCDVATLSLPGFVAATLVQTGSTSLVSFSGSYSSLLDTFGIVSLSPLCTSLSVENAPNVSEILGLEDGYVPNLQSLTLTNVGSYYVPPARLPDLRVLSVTDMPNFMRFDIDAADGVVSTKDTVLEQLTLDNCPGVTTLDTINTCTTLTDLTIRNMPELTWDGVPDSLLRLTIEGDFSGSVVANSKPIQEVSLTGFTSAPEWDISFAFCNALTSINIATSFISYLTLGNCSGLQELTLDAFTASAIGAVNVSGSPSLNELPDFIGASALTQFSAYDLAALSQLPSFAACETVSDIAFTNCGTVPMPPPDVGGCIGLAFFLISGTPLTTPPAVAGLSALEFLVLPNCGLTSPPSLMACTNLQLLLLSDNPLAAAPEYLSAYCPALSEAYFQNCSFDQAQVDIVLADFAYGTVSYGTLDLRVSDGIVPSAAGLADKATLESRGWTVLVNS